MTGWDDVLDALETALVVVDDRDLIVRANARFARLAGLAPDSSVGVPAGDALPHDELPALSEAMSSTRRDRRSRTVRSPDTAGPRSLECRVTAAGTQLVLELWDVTNYAEAERRRREVEAAREVIWEHSRAHYLVVDVVGRRMDASPQVRRSWPIDSIVADVEAGRLTDYLDCPHRVTDAWPSAAALVDGRMQRAIAEVFASGEEMRYRHRVPMPDGVTRFFDTQIVPWDVGGQRRGVVFVTHDYTRYVRAERLGSAAAEALDGLLASLPVQVWDLDLASGIVTPVAGSVGLLGPVDAPASLRRLTSGLPEEARLGLWKALEESTQETSTTVTFLEPAAQRWLQVSFRRLPIAFDGSARAVVVVTDLTEQMALLDRERKVDHASHVLRFAQGVAHDFGNVAQVIGGFAQLLQENPSPEVVAMASARLSVAASRGVAVARRISAIARIEQVVNEPTDLSALVESAVPHLQELAGPDVRVYAEVAGGLVAIAESGHVISALENLVENATEAMEGRGAIRLGVALVTDDGRAMVEVSVSDNGPGVPTHLLGRVFDPFVTGRPSAGTGLGLYLVYEYLLSVGGRASVTSDDQGATFRLLFPLGA